MKRLKSLFSVYFSQLSVFMSCSAEVVKLANEDRPYFNLTDEEIYELPLETRKWLAIQAIRLYRVRDEKRINLIKTWYQLPQNTEL